MEAHAKRAALVTYLTTVLAAHQAAVDAVYAGRDDWPEFTSATLHTATWYRRATEPLSSRADRTQVMGDPCYYLEVLPTVIGAHQRSESRRVVRRSDRVQVTLYLQYLDADTYANTSFSAFETIIDSRDRDAPGVLFAVEETKASGGVGWGLPVNMRQGIDPLDGRAVETAHFLTFELDLIG